MYSGYPRFLNELNIMLFHVSGGHVALYLLMYAIADQSEKIYLIHFCPYIP